MTNKVLLNNISHAELRVARRYGAEFGDAVNQMLVFPTEFEEAQRELPIFFRRDADGAFQAVALLGLDRDENLFLGGDGHWQTRYVPAVQARGPFSIVMQQAPAAAEPEPMVHIDLDDPRVGTEEGEPLFLPHGGNSTYLEHVAAVLRRIYHGIEHGKAMFAALDEAGLLQPVAVEIKLDDTRQYNVPNLFTVGQDRLAALDGAALQKLNREGHLRLAVLAAASLGNVGRLIELKNQKARADG